MEAEGLCPQDRKRKLLLLPPAFGGPVPSLPGRVGHGNGSGHGSPRRNGRGEPASHGWARGLSPLWARGLHLPWQAMPKGGRLHTGSQKHFKKKDTEQHGTSEEVSVCSIDSALSAGRGRQVGGDEGPPARSCVPVLK